MEVIALAEISAGDEFFEMFLLACVSYKNEFRYNIK